jgi:predicted DNA-binding transcriptional regulator AlpA
MDTTYKAVENLLNERDVARITGLSLGSIRRWRLLRQGPKFLKLNAAVRYRLSDLEAWLESRPVGGSATQPDWVNTGRAPQATASISRRKRDR